MPVILLFLLGTPAAALATALRGATRGWKVAGWAALLLMLPMVLVLLSGQTVLAQWGLAWRSTVKTPCAVGYACGFWLTMIQLGAAMWRRADRWERFAVAGRCAAIAATVLLCTYVSWWVLFCSLFWAGGDRDVVIHGERMVEEQIWMDWDYYAYHGSVVRGSERIYSSWELYQERRQKELGGDSG